eukprot:COSAG06_NODE_253_length_19061_cov_33.083114_11_plen_85_part_00
MAKTVVPPPVVLDDEWEKSMIEANGPARPEPSAADPMSHTHPNASGGTSAAAKRRRAWKRRRAYRAGSLRIFTLSGLQASATSR